MLDGIAINTWGVFSSPLKNKFKGGFGLIMVDDDLTRLTQV